MVTKQTRMTAREWAAYRTAALFDRITPRGAGRFDVALLGGRVLLRVTVDGRGGALMPRLNAATIKALTRPGRYADERTLYLNIAPRGSRSWIQRLAINGRRRDIGLGGWPLVPAATARARALANRVAVEAGADPLAAKRRANVPTFRAAAEATYEATRPRWRSQTTAKNWRQQMERHAYPTLADLPVTQVGREDVLRVLTPLWTAHPDVARKMRTRVRAVLAWAQAHGSYRPQPRGRGD